ncbi:hypothetical protein GCM10009817_09510 [Terrabacter lapilli]|uniref:Uncharacterized protein n=1 Tax=Terrabacter lapilli TaxID=436231 RepID=A0ABN2RM87_9MICO
MREQDTAVTDQRTDNDRLHSLMRSRTSDKASDQQGTGCCTLASARGVGCAAAPLCLAWPGVVAWAAADGDAETGGGGPTEEVAAVD